MTLRCDTCAAYVPGDLGPGYCHLAPPRSVRDARNEMWTPFPAVQPDWWCLQHQPKAPQTQSDAPQSAVVQHQPIAAPEDDFA
jgi:hypothetical protein